MNNSHTKNNNYYDANLPEEIKCVFECTFIISSFKFNYFGTLLAVGGQDGRLLIFDYNRENVVWDRRIFRAPIYSISWNQNGHLISCCTATDICIFRLVDSTAIYRFHLKEEITSIICHPSIEYLFLFNFCKFPSTYLHLNSHGNELMKSCRPLPRHEHHGIEENDTISNFTSNGQYVLSGNQRGKISVFSINNRLARKVVSRLNGKESLKYLKHFRVSSQSSTPTSSTNNNMSSTSNLAIKQIVCRSHDEPDDEYILINVSDRYLLLYQLSAILSDNRNDTIEPLQLFQDNIDKLQMKRSSLNFDGSMVATTSMKQQQYRIWSSMDGSCIQEIPKHKNDQITDIDWHPKYHELVTTHLNCIIVRSAAIFQNWAAWVPNFRQLHENEVYEERESEFDVYDEDASSISKSPNSNEIIDCYTIDPNDFNEHDNEDNLLHLPLKLNNDEDEKTLQLRVRELNNDIPPIDLNVEEKSSYF
ncbi:hypothetical protein SNEBB_003851 [Seison nebaliae]|nr:hypothetical protein SNEBB_003851 [Seison nebaliae]